MSEIKNIGIRLEGGLGDHLLANRFVPAIKEIHPKANLHIYSDTEGNNRFVSFLASIFPSYFKSWTVIPSRKDKNHKIKSQFGEEVYSADINNAPDEYLEAFSKFDKFYDLCLDRLEWTNYDFDWWRYFYFFPRPEVLPNYSWIKVREKFILANLYSRSNSSFTLEKWYVERLVKELSKDIAVVIPTTEENIGYYDFCRGWDNVIVKVTDLPFTFYLASKCSAFIGVDSGIRCMPYYFGKPTFYFSTFCRSYGDVSPAHLLRWVIYPNQAFPMYHPIDLVVRALDNSVSAEACKLFPMIHKSVVDNAIIRRKIE